ncbi:hypothetical protein [Parafilimonas sp.]|uniref:hypothetical protein n=1 Tax=Parafilimonas sp. TaxID=1969739 RepID=UPI0039E6975E
MYSYALLEPGYFYLVQEKENEELILLQVKVVSDYCMYVEKYHESIVQEWKRKTDPVFDIVELLSDEKMKEWTNAYYSNEDAFYEEDDE